MGNDPRVEVKLYLAGARVYGLSEVVETDAAGSPGGKALVVAGNVERIELSASGIQYVLVVGARVYTLPADRVYPDFNAVMEAARVALSPNRANT